MKQRISILLILLLVISLFAAGCSGGEDTTPQEPEDMAEVQEEGEDISQEPEETPAPDGSIQDEISAGEADVEEEPDNTQDQEEPEAGEDEPAQVVETEPELVPEEQKEEATEQTSDEAQEEPVVAEPQIVQEGPLLKVEGRVSTPLSLDLSQLKSMDSLIYSADYYWLNSFGSTGHTSFKGIKLWGLLTEEAGIGSDAQTVRIVATDGYEMTFTVDQIRKQDYIDETDDSKKLPVIVAWQEDGSQYDSDKGPPYKLVVGQKEAGDVNKPQWVSNIDRIIVE
ncbi:MAG: molybdopterin-dependent oxidoreductase [Gudongella sp.]|nr:molybdopterin-dependent oxidoreductase [Gudongella sp.]